jgi:AcrR family transcriptional regulator
VGRTRIDPGRLVVEALAVVDRDGLDALTLSAVSGALGVGPSALYTHVEGLDGLRRLVALAATENLTNEVRTATAGATGADALLALGAAYRGFARAHPGQFASTLRRADGGDDRLAAADREVTEVFVVVYAGMGMTPDASHLAARSSRSAIHGFLVLEHTGGTSPAHDREYAHLLDTLQRGLGAR